MSLFRNNEPDSWWDEKKQWLTHVFFHWGKTMDWDDFCPYCYDEDDYGM